MNLKCFAFLYCLYVWRQIKVLHNCYQTCQKSVGWTCVVHLCFVKVQRQNKSCKRHDLPTLFLRNSRSLNNKFDELQLLFANENIDIAAITETWFRSDLPPGELGSIPGYNIYAEPRINKRGGCIAL